MKILAIVAARSRSKGVKNKNIRLIGGKPLIFYTIEQIIRWRGYEKFIVSTDSTAIADIAKRGGAEVPFMRPMRLARDDVGKLDVLRHTLSEAEKYYGLRFDAVLDLDATSPVRTIKDIDNIVRMFKEKKADCVFSVVKARKNPYFNMVEKQLDGTVKLCKRPSTEIVTRQSAPLVFQMNASMYVYNRDFLLDKNNKTPYSKIAYAYEMPQEAAIDIDTEIDFKFIEFLLKERIISL